MQALIGTGCVLALAGCGFHLRGMGPGDSLSIDRIALASAGGPTDPLLRQVEQELKSAGVVISEGAPWRLNLGESAFQERQLTYGDAGVQEREVTLSVPWSLQRVMDGAYLTSQETLTLDGTYYTSSDQLLTRDDARQQLYVELRRQAARRLIDRLQAIVPEAQSGDAQGAP